jgi:hypothetical protein
MLSELIKCKINGIIGNPPIAPPKTYAFILRFIDSFRCSQNKKSEKMKHKNIPDK